MCLMLCASLDWQYSELPSSASDAVLCSVLIRKTSKQIEKEKEKNATGVMNTTDELNFLKISFQTKTNTGTGAIFFINGYTFALIRHNLGIFLCDSHSRNEEEFITSDGASVLLKFKTLDEVQNIIEEVYMLSQNFHVLIYQIQYINIEVWNADISLILNSANKIKNRALKRKHRATIFGTAEHEKNNMQRREKYASISGTPEHKNLKAQQRETKIEKYANIFGTPEHEHLRAQQREKYANIFGTHDT